MNRSMSWMRKCAPKRVASRSRWTRSTGAVATKTSPRSAAVPGREGRPLRGIECGVVDRNVHFHICIHLVEVRLTVTEPDDFLRHPRVSMRHVLEETILL